MNSSRNMVRLLRQSLCCSVLLVLVPAFVGAQDTGRWATPADFMKATGNTIAAFGEAPMLQEMVAQGSAATCCRAPA